MKVGMETQLEFAKRGDMTLYLKSVAHAESMESSTLLHNVAQGDAVIMCRKGKAVGIGKGLRTKVNVNIGTSPSKINPEEEVQKAILAEKYGADTITDLSTGGDIAAIRKRILENTTIPITTVPIYQTAAQVGIEDMKRDDIIATIKKQAEEGVSSVVLHCINKKIITNKKIKRIMGIVSKGGAMTIGYMLRNQSENPFLENFPEILEILKKYDIVLSLGNSMRSGCIHDKMDVSQIEEMKLNAQLARQAYEQNVQVIIEGAGGHIRANKVSAHIKFYKTHSNAPLFVAGPLPTDIAVGYDHIAGCVGASIASGADYLCYITPAEHIGLPNLEQVKEGLIAFKIAAHIGDTIKYNLDGRDKDLSIRRSKLDWRGQIEYAIDGDILINSAPNEGPCTMCGKFCALKLMKEL
jgi:phosphomethylpyrimidine synthase